MTTTNHNSRSERPLLILGADAPRSERIRTRLLAAAQSLGIEHVTLPPGAGLESLERLIAGADAVAVCAEPAAQALVATVAAARNLPFSCIPAGIDDLLARDLGVPLEDPAEALALVFSGEERMCDFGEVNGLTFVNYVAIGLGPAILRMPEPAVAHRAAGLPTVLVANGSFALGTGELGPRAWPESGLLGVLVLREDGAAGAAPSPHAAGWEESSCPRLELPARGEVSAAVDGCPRILHPPLRFRSVPRALRVRVAARPAPLGRSAPRGGAAAAGVGGSR
jgi:hypothetical protein